MSLRPSILFFLLSGLILSGCASTGTHRTLSVRDLEAPVLIERISQRQSGLTSIEAEGSIALETPTFSNSGSIELHIKEPDSMFVNIEGPFGINVASALLTNTTFQFYNSLQNKLIHGTTSRQMIGSLLHVDIGFKDILDLFVGAVSFDRNSPVPTAYYVEDDRYVLVYKTPDETTSYWIDPAAYSITQIQVKNPKGDLIREIAFSDFRTQDNHLLPYRFRVSDFQSRRSLTVMYSKAFVNRRNVTFPFSVPEDAEHIEWQ